ncbi:MAG TPA: response regulator [Pyrinomonadaceae bacterium]|nr:response regulator [Pyrinomonadaceae bacterium]
MPRPKLLLADDSTTIQKVVNLTFGDQGMDVFTFSDGDSAIAQFDEIKPDVVMADVHMPGMSGYRLCELVRQNEASRDTPVLLLVGSFELFDPEEAQRVGASGHLTKPFSSIADLISTVDGLVKSSPASRSSEEPLPDTSDIDSLYHQSFVETVEIPKNGPGDSAYELGELDDEMIQTSYAGQNVGDDETYYDVDESEETIGPNGEAGEPEALIVESVPVETFDERVNEEYIAPPPAVYDPFDSIAAEPSTGASTREDREQEGIRFTIDNSDLLEIPAASAPPGNRETVAAEEPADEAKVPDLSPELIDLIVDKVVERLEQRAKSGAAHSVSGN